ncbi:glycosyltransferase [Alphaproteobacteria bacterium]|nr:glycosyltransferase [Alphaproteobacteria bacterium]MDC1157088.1 glycosyltransferase [Alphaproteobacteria bacterium]
MRYKILVVGSFRSRELGVVGGIARSCEELINSDFVERFDIFTVDSSQRANPPPNVYVRSGFALFRLFNFTTKLVRYRPNGVLLFFSSGMSFYEKMVMGWLAKFSGAKVFLFPRAGALMIDSCKSRLLGFFNRVFFRCGDVFLAQGRGWEYYAIEAWGYQEQNTYVVPNWTAANQYYALGAARMEMVREKRVSTIAFVGWLEVEKGVQELMEACLMLVESGVPFFCVLAGDGTQRAWIEAFIVEHNLDRVVKLQGWLHGEELLEHYRNADIFVLPSWNEGMPNSLIEAMSSGLCPVVTSVGIIPDFLNNGEHGLLVEPRSAQALSDALSSLITTPNLQVSYARAAYALSRQFDKNRVIPLLCDIFETNLSR